MNTKLVKKYLKILLMYIFLVIAFYFIAGEQIKYTTVNGEMPKSNQAIGNLHDGVEIEQAFEATADTLDRLSFHTFTFNGLSDTKLEIIIQKDDQVLSQTSVNSKQFSDSEPFVLQLNPRIELEQGKQYILKMIFNSTTSEIATLYYTEGIQGINGTNEPLKVNGQSLDGQLCVRLDGSKQEFLGIYYWQIAGVIFIILGLYVAWADWCARKGRWTILSLLLAIYQKYEFLIKQLVARDFKVKYKRSALGYCWSFLNPLLTMLVQYVVFSTIFKSGIENFPVYLLSGNIIFGFFTDAVGQGLNSIIGNASLITKVYVPKYIYPATKVFSSAINLFISVIPLLLVTLLTGGQITVKILLLPYALFCLILFCMGMVLLLSAANVFFRDVQYLWGIVSLIWMYATPIFYPANIIPENLRFIQTLNPMYHIITFVRSILIDGVSPSPDIYLSCLISAIVAFLIGAFVFKKTQGKFVLYI